MTAPSLVAQESGLEAECPSGLLCMFGGSNLRGTLFTASWPASVGTIAFYKSQLNI